MPLSPSVTGLFVGSLAVLVSVFVFGGWLLGQRQLARRRGTWSPLTEELLRVPGHSLRLETDALQDDLLGCYLQFVGMSVFIVAAWLVHDDPRVRWTVVAMAGAIMLRALWRAPRLLERFRRVTLGRECEEYVGQELNLLMRDGAFVFHDIPYRYGNIDHVVVGRDRVLVVETKGRRKPRSASGERVREARVRFDGRTLSFPGYETTEPLEQARRHAAHVREAIRCRCGIDCPVIPVVAIPGWFVDAAPYEEGGVLVVNARRAKALRPWLGRRTAGRARTAPVAHYLNSLARTVAPHSRGSDPGASDFANRPAGRREPALG